MVFTTHIYGYVRQDPFVKFVMWCEAREKWNWIQVKEKMFNRKVTVSWRFATEELVCEEKKKKKKKDASLFLVAKRWVAVFVREKK